VTLTQADKVLISQTKCNIVTRSHHITSRSWYMSYQTDWNSDISDDLEWLSRSFLPITNLFKRDFLVQFFYNCPSLSQIGM